MQGLGSVVGPAVDEIAPHDEAEAAWVHLQCVRRLPSEVCHARSARLVRVGVGARVGLVLGLESGFGLENEGACSWSRVPELGSVAEQGILGEGWTLARRARPPPAFCATLRRSSARMGGKQSVRVTRAPSSASTMPLTPTPAPSSSA